MYKMQPYECPSCGETILGIGLDRHLQECGTTRDEERKVEKILADNPELSVEVVYRLV